MISLISLFLSFGGTALQSENLIATEKNQTYSQADEIAADLPLWWAPEWRHNGDCGPLSLFVAMKLCGHEVTLENVESVCQWNEDTGTTISALRETAKDLGAMAEVLFVDPSEFHKLKCPFIFHGLVSEKDQIGHFGVCLEVNPDKNTVLVMNPSLEKVSLTKLSSFKTQVSGYVLVIRDPIDKLTEWIFKLIICICLLQCVYFLFVRTRRWIGCERTVHAMVKI